MLRVVGLILSLAFGEHVELSFDQEKNRNMNLNIQVEKETVSHNKNFITQEMSLE